jgi:hypothetical protein
MDVWGGVRRTDVRPQCPELLSPRGTQPGLLKLVPASAVSWLSNTLLLTSVGVTVRHGMALGAVLDRLALQRGGWPFPAGLSLVPRISAWASSGEGASLSSEAHGPVSVARPVRVS